MYIAEDTKGNRLLAFITGNEEDVIANGEYRPLTSSLLVVKGEKGFMLLFNRWRQEWELAGGMIDEGETPREAAIRECSEESGCEAVNVRFVGILKFFLVPSRNQTKARIEYTALYAAALAEERTFRENDEMLGICWHRLGEPIENASLIDLKLLEYAAD